MQDFHDLAPSYSQPHLPPLHLWIRVFFAVFPKQAMFPNASVPTHAIIFKLGETSPYFHINPCPSHYYSITLQFLDTLYSLAEILEAFSYSAFLLGLDGHSSYFTLTEYSSIISLPQWDVSLFQPWNRKLLEIEIGMCVIFYTSGFIKVLIQSQCSSDILNYGQMLGI